MSNVICDYTGIIVSLGENQNLLDDPDMVFTLKHPLANYSTVVKTFKYKLKVGNQYKPLLAGAILSTLRHYNLLRIHNSKAEVLIANQLITKQARSAGLLLSILHKLINQEERLRAVGAGVKLPRELHRREYKFCLESATLQGNELEGANRFFLANLQEWIGMILPPTREELLGLSNQHQKGQYDFNKDYGDSIDKLELTDGRVVLYSDVVDAVESARVMLEDNIYKGIKRMSSDRIQKKVRAYIKLAASVDYNVFNKKQVKALNAMVKELDYSQKVLGKAIAMLDKAAVRFNSQSQKTAGGRSQQKANKLYETIAWLKASDLEFRKLGFSLDSIDGLEGLDGVDTVTAITAVTEQAVTEPKESLQDRLARIKGGK